MEESCVEKSEDFDGRKDGVIVNEAFVDEYGESSSSSDCLASVNEEHCNSELRCTFDHNHSVDFSQESEKPKLEKQGSTFFGMCIIFMMNLFGHVLVFGGFFFNYLKLFYKLSVVHLWGWVEIQMMKDRFSKLLLGEDMSGCGDGVCTALVISNAITNLCGMLCRLYVVDWYELGYRSSVFFIVKNIAILDPIFSYPFWPNMEIRTSTS